MTTRKRRIGDPIKLGRTVVPDNPYACYEACRTDDEVNERVELERKLKIADEAGIGDWARIKLLQLEEWMRVAQNRIVRINEMRDEIADLEHRLQVAEDASTWPW